MLREQAAELKGLRAVLYFKKQVLLCAHAVVLTV